MRSVMLGALLALMMGAQAEAASYKLEIEAGQGNILRGRGGLHALDIRTDDTLLRVIAPGNRIDKRGTVRVLVMNLGKPRYDFGPANVSIELPDGSALPEVPVRVFDAGEELVAREVRRGAATARSVEGSLTSVAQSAESGLTAQRMTGQSQSGGSVRGEAQRLDEVDSQVPGAKLLDGLNGVLRPYNIGPQEAWGGYLIFDMPKTLRRRDADQPVTIVVQTGNDVHRIRAVLKKI